MALAQLPEPVMRQRPDNNIRTIIDPSANTSSPTMHVTAAIAANTLQQVPDRDKHRWHRLFSVWWRDARYRLWQQERQREAPGLGSALLRLGLASLLHPRLAADAPEGAALVPVDMIRPVAASHDPLLLGFRPVATCLNHLGFCGALEGHCLRVWSLHFSPDGQKIVSASADKTVRVWSATTGVCEQTLTDHRSVAMSAHFSPDGHTIVSTHDDQTVRVWSAATGACMQTLTGAGTPQFSPDAHSRKIVSTDGSLGGSVRVWSVTEPELLIDYARRVVAGDRMQERNKRRRLLPVLAHGYMTL
jgi:WD40 repeat protein